MIAAQDELEEIRHLTNGKDTKSIRGLVSTGGQVDRIQVILAVLFTILLILFSAFLFVSAYWLYFQDNPAVEFFDAWLINGKRERVETLVVNPGDRVTYYLDWCKYTDVGVELRRIWLNDTVTIVRPDYPPNKAPGCFERWPVTVMVPDDLMPGEYVLETEAFFEDVNPLASRSGIYQVGTFVIPEVE